MLYRDLKKRLALLLALLLVLTGAPALSSGAEDAGAEEAPYRTLLEELLLAYEEQRSLEVEDALLQDDVARSIAEHWQKVYLDAEYPLLLYGKDAPETIPVTGRHAFVVLGYELLDGEMTPELMGRCDAAAAAAQAWPDSILVCSGGATGPNNPEGHTEAGLMKDYLIGCGIAQERIFTDERAMTTAENAINTFAILQEQGVETMTIVTSSYHQRWGQVLYNALAALYQRDHGFTAQIVGNYCFDIEPSVEIFRQDAQIAVWQLGGILGLSEEDMAFMPNPLIDLMTPPPDYALESCWAYYALGEDKPADLFLICPTVDVKDEFNMSLEDEETRASFLGALNMERGIYEDSARLFAPYYRQAAMKVYSLEEGERERYLDMAYRDVSAAFAWYLEHENNGRPILLAGFSQGADMCYRLLAEYFGDTALQEQLVAVYALGWPCTEELTRQYPQIVPAQGADDVGVVISFDCEAPRVKETFINPAGQRAFAINPLNWRTDGTPADKSENLGACFTDYSGEVTREETGLCGCWLDESRGVVKVTDVDPEAYPAIVPGLPEGAYHVYDYQFFFRNLQENVALRTARFLQGGALDEIRARGVLRVGTTGDYNPMAYLDPETGAYVGFDVELAEDLAAALGVEIEYVPTTWPTLSQDTLAGRFDLALCGITITDARKETMLMSEGYLGNGKTILCRAEDAGRYLSLEDIDRPEVTVMVNPGGLNEQFAREHLPHCTLVIHDVNQEIPALIAAGEADIMITEIMEAGYYVGRDDRLAAPLIHEPFTRGELGVLMPRGSEDLLEWVNAFLEEERSSGRLEELADEYIYGAPQDEAQDAAA